MPEDEAGNKRRGPPDEENDDRAASAETEMEPEAQRPTVMPSVTLPATLSRPPGLWPALEGHGGFLLQEIQP